MSQNQPPSSFGNRHLTTAATSSSSLPDLFLAAASLLLLLSSGSPRLSLLPPNPRRFFLKLPSMSRRSSPPPPLRRRFSTPQSLSDWLAPRLPSESFASWGVKPGTKNVHNLWLEIADGETSLDDATTPPVRSVRVATVRIVGEGGKKILVESHQEMSDGSVRRRFRPLSEKMKPEESLEASVFRAVKEELGSVLGNGDLSEVLSIIPDSYSFKVEERNSMSYPGLPARYILHSVDATVEGLPQDDFYTDEEEYGGSEEETQAVTVKRHYWKWISPEALQA